MQHIHTHIHNSMEDMVICLIYAVMVILTVRTISHTVVQFQDILINTIVLCIELSEFPGHLTYEHTIIINDSWGIGVYNISDIPSTP